MPSLVEAAATVVLSAGVMATVTASLATSARLHAQCTRLADDLFRSRQLEHLVDRAAASAGMGPGHPAAVTAVSADTIVFEADQNGDGVVDSTSSETSALESRAAGSDARVRVRLGRQTMTVLEAERSDASLSAVDRHGAAANATTAALVGLTISARDAPAQEPKRLWVAIPARFLP